jgi:transcriptional regulator with XRE-family HTH domain
VPEDHHDLGAFLRARREALTPADVGLPDSGRRRTPGLRREEVAALAGVSMDYLIRLEQGRDTRPSASVLMALADALQLDEDARTHLKMLSCVTGAAEFCPAAVAESREVPATVLRLVDQLVTPAYVVTPYNDVLAMNEGWRALVEPLGLLDGDVPNLARFTFLDPRAVEVYLDWDAVAAHQVSALRAASVRWGDGPHMSLLLADLQEDPAFAARWSAHAVAEKRRGEKRLLHPELGALRIAFEVLLLPDASELRLVSWLPADARTEAAFATLGLTATPVSPAVLRVVGEG